MLETKDIRDRIQSDFTDHVAEAFTLFEHAIIKSEHLNNDRVLRCILFLANGDMAKLQTFIEAATNHPRDVIYWAEYINHDSPDKTKQVRDFTKPFEHEPDPISPHDYGLVEFNHEIWNSWRLNGYKFIRYRRIDENRAALKPFVQINEPQDEEEMYTFFEIGEDEVREWADNNDVLLPDFTFLVESGYP